jgi:hypothetical protein
MKRLSTIRPLVWSAYGLIAVVVTGVWVYCARTEYAVEFLDVRLPSGEAYSSRFASITRLAEGRAFSPFVKRRLLPDLARGLAAVLPPALWAPVRRALTVAAHGPPWLQVVLGRQGWKPEHVPILACAYFLIGCSVLGFMLTCRRLLTLLYETPRWVADLTGLLMGPALLGCYGDWHYCGYPYDYPTAFVFALALLGLLGRRWWFPAAFAAAAYSKETAVLLIAAYVLVDFRWRSVRSWLVLGLLAGLYAAVRGWIALNYRTPEPEQGFWFPARNAKVLAAVFFSNWWLPFYAVGLARIVGLWPQFPFALRRLCWLLLPMVGLAFFKGWLEELRQYLELLPVFGLLLLQWCLHEAGLGHLLVARKVPRTDPASPRAPGQPIRFLQRAGSADVAVTT